MRLLVFGGTGMLGHQLWETCRTRLDAYFTVRSSAVGGAAAAVLEPDRAVPGVRAEDPASIGRALDETGAQVAVNCIGIVKQVAGADNLVETIQANALFPHQLAAACRERGVRLIQVSTDCVFSGREGPYTEEHDPDPADALRPFEAAGRGGRPRRPDASNIDDRQGAGDHQRPARVVPLPGARNGPRLHAAPCSAVPPRRSYRALIADLVEGQEALEGVWHVGAEPIAKHDLLLLHPRGVRPRRRGRARRQRGDRPQPRLDPLEERRPDGTHRVGLR